MTACAHPPARCADIACRERKVCMYAVEVAPVGASDPVSRDGEGGSEVHEVKPSPPTEHHKNSESLRITPSPSSEGQDLAALSERLLRDVEAYAGKTVMLVRVDSMSTILSALSAATKRAGELDAIVTAAQIARDEAGFVGTIDDCIRCFDGELSAATRRAEAAEGALAKFEGLNFVVQYRRKECGAWANMAAFDSGTIAERYAKDCEKTNRPWEYRARGLTGEGAER